jgi:hypothetical protein
MPSIGTDPSSTNVTMPVTVAAVRPSAGMPGAPSTKTFTTWVNPKYSNRRLLSVKELMAFNTFEARGCNSLIQGDAGMSGADVVKMVHSHYMGELKLAMSEMPLAKGVVFCYIPRDKSLSMPKREDIAVEKNIKAYPLSAETMDLIWAPSQVACASAKAGSELWHAAKTETGVVFVCMAIPVYDTDDLAVICGSLGKFVF